MRSQFDARASSSLLFALAGSLSVALSARGDAGVSPPRLVDVEPPSLSAPGRDPVEVTLELLIDREGRVVEAEVVEPVGERLDEAARNSALGALFEPAILGGDPVPSKIRFVVRFEPPPIEPAPEENEPVTPEPAERTCAADEEPIEVVVTGSRAEEGAQGSAVRVDVIARREIEEGGIRNAAEALEEAHGVQVNRTFRGMELWIRGLDPEYSLILVDSAIAPGRVGGAVDLSRYGAEEIERIEVVRGPGSALYGSEAIGGVVNIITREPRHDLRVSATGSYGSRNTADATARVEGKLARELRVGLNGGFHHEDAFRREASSVETAGSRRVQGTVGGRADYRLSSRNRLSLRASYLYLRMEGVERGTASAVFDRTQLQEQFQVSAEHRHERKARVQFTQRVTYTQFREQTLLDQRGAAQLDRLEDQREHMVQYTGVARLPLTDRHEITLGLDPMAQLLDSPRLEKRGERVRFGAFAQYDARAAQPRWGELRLVPALRADVDSRFGSQISPKLTARLDASDAVVFRASYGRGFRAPSFQQLMLRFENPSVGYVIEGNPELGAERSHGVDAGFEARVHPTFRLGASFFRNDLEDMIAVVSGSVSPEGGQVFTYANLERAWTMGAEADARLEVERWLGAKLGYSFTQTWDGENQRRLEGRPRHRVTASLRGEVPSWGIVGTARAAIQIGRTYYVSEGEGDAGSPAHAGAIAQIDLRLEKRFGEALALFVGVENLADAGDAYLLLRPRTFYGGIGTRLTRGEGDDARR